MKLFSKAKLTTGLTALALLGGLLFATSHSALADTSAANSPDGIAISDSPCATNGSFLSFPPWWEYSQSQTIGGKCSPYIAWPGGVWAIALAILDILLHVAGIAAVISIIISSVMYVTSAGNGDRTSAALNRIINSLIGLAIVLAAASIVAFLGDRL